MSHEDSGLIKASIQEVFKIATPRDYQIEAIHHCIYNDNATLYIIRKTAEGKSLIPLTVALLKGVAICLVPLIGLGSDQVRKALRCPD